VVLDSKIGRQAPAIALLLSLGGGLTFGARDSRAKFATGCLAMQLARRVALPHQEWGVTMKTAPISKPMRSLPRPVQKVRWRNPELARACGWEDVFGPGPFAVIRIKDNSAHGLAMSFILQTELGEQEISEVWLADESESVTRSC